MNSEENEDLKLPDGWILCQSKSSPGRRYFFNTKTGKSSWTQPQDEEESEQKKQKNKKEKPSIREKRKKIETQKKILKRKSDGDDDSLTNKKQRPESTPDEDSPSPANPVTPSKYTEPKPVDKEPTLKPILTKNSANARLAQLRARLSSEAQADEHDSPSQRLRIPRTPAPFTEQKSVRFNLQSPPANDFNHTTRLPTESLPSPSQFLTANKIISSIKAHLPDQFSNVRPRDTFADIEEGICNQTTEYPFMKHPATPPQFSEASKIVSAIKSKLPCTPVDYKDDRARSIAYREYMDKVRNFKSSKDTLGLRNDRVNNFPVQERLNHRNMETGALVQPEFMCNRQDHTIVRPEFMGNRQDHTRSLIPNKDQLIARNDRPVPSVPTIRPTDPRQDKLRTFISEVRNLNNIENKKLRTVAPVQEHINYSEYKARHSLPNRTHTDQMNHVDDFRNNIQNRLNQDNLRTLPGRNHVQDNFKNPIIGRKEIEVSRTQVPGRSVEDNRRNSIEDNRRTSTVNRRIEEIRIPTTRPRIEADLRPLIRRSIEADLRGAMLKKSKESDVRTQTSIKRKIEDDVRIPISNRLIIEKSHTSTPNTQNVETKLKPRVYVPIKKQIEPQSHNREKSEETSSICSENSQSAQEISKLDKTIIEDKLETHLPNRHPTDEKSRKQLEENIPILNKESTPEIVSPVCNEQNLEAHNTDKENLGNEKIPIPEMTSIEEELARMDQKSPQNQNLVNHIKEVSISLENCIKPDKGPTIEDQLLENHLMEEDEMEPINEQETTVIQNQELLNQEITEPEEHIQEIKTPEHNKEAPFTSDDSIITLSDDSNDGVTQDYRKPEEIETFTSAKDRMNALRNRLSKEAEEVGEITEITDVEFLNSIKLPSPNVITDEEYLNMIELPKYPSEAMEVDSRVDLESTSISCQPSRMDPNAEIVLVVDTNIFIHELDVIKNVLNSHIKGYTEQPTLLVPWRVINELDCLKDNNNGNGAICKRARAAMDYLYKSLPENDRIKGQSLRDSNSHIYPCESPDDEILNCCLQQAERGKAVILLSNDKNLCNKAAINGVRCIGLDELKPLLESKPQPAPPGLCDSVKHCEANMYLLLANILENEMRAKYNNLWQHVIFKAPPWSLTDVLQCILKHWIAVFNEVFPRIEPLITDLKNTLVCIENKDPKSLTESEVSNFKEVCLEIAKKCLIIPEYMELAKTTVERLQRNPSEAVNPTEMAVIEAFEKLWTVFSSYCAQLCSAIGLECSLEDKLGGSCTSRELGERWPVYSAQLYALTLAIKGSLCLEDSELTEEQVDELEDVFKESLALVRMDGSKVNKDNLRVFATKCRNMLQEAATKFSGLTELLNVCKQRMETM